MNNESNEFSAVHQTQMRLKPPRKCKTPYGGRLSYILPGKNKLTIHLKDKNKIRHRKRWSQVMYLYYLLGYRLMMKVDEQSRKVRELGIWRDTDIF